MKFKNYEAYLFDFDFTLITALPGIVMSYNHAFKAYGLPERDESTIKKTVGLPVVDSFMRMNDKVNPDLAKKLRDEFDLAADRFMTANTSFLPGCAELLEKLNKSGKKTGVVTTKYAYRVRDFFDSKGLSGCISVLIGGSDVKKHKPDPEGLLKACAILENEYSIDKKHVIFIGDSFVDGEAAMSAGIDFAAVTTGTTSCEDLKKYNPLAICGDMGSLERYFTL